MSKYDQLKKKKDAAFTGAKQEIEHVYTLAEESRRVASVAHNAGEIITELDRQFAAATKLSGRDIAFLFLATALQCTKWILMPEFDLNLDGNGSIGGDHELKNLPDIKEQDNESPPTSERQPEKEGHYTWQQILLSPTPYLCDLYTLPESESPLNALLKKDDTQDHFDVWGNDPLFGWVFGTLNILSRTVTLKDLRTFDVSLDRESLNLPSFLLSKDELHVIPEPTVSISEMLSDCYATMQEDPKRLFAAVAKQAVRQFSNSPEKFGVAIPFLCEHTPDEVADDMRNAGRWAKYTKNSINSRKNGLESDTQDVADAGAECFDEGTSHHFGEYSSKAFNAYESAQGMTGRVSLLIDKIQSYLDSLDGMDSTKSLLQKARDDIDSAQEYLNKPMDAYYEYASMPNEYLDKAQEAIMSSRERIVEARNYIKEVIGIVGILEIGDGPLGKMLDNADGLLGGAADMVGSVQDLLSNPQNLVSKIEELAEKGWNKFSNNELVETIAKDLAIIGLQAGISILINALIRALHTLCYDEHIDGDPKMYEARTRKILSYSNVIASGSNIIYVALSKNIKKLDIGGIAVSIYRIVTDYRLIRDLKREFLSKQWYDVVIGDDTVYDFLKEKADE